MRVLIALLIGWLAVNVVIVLVSIIVSKVDSAARARQRAALMRW